MDGELSRAYRRIKKSRGWNNPLEISKDLKTEMVRLLPLSPLMAEDIAVFFISAAPDDNSVYRAQEVLELFDGSWERGADSLLTENDWEYIRDSIDEWAAEMDMEIVTFIMRIIVESGGFKG